MPVNKHIRTSVRSDKYPFPGHLSESDHMLLASTLERELAGQEEERDYQLEVCGLSQGLQSPDYYIGRPADFSYP